MRTGIGNQMIRIKSRSVKCLSNLIHFQSQRSCARFWTEILVTHFFAVVWAFCYEYTRSLYTRSLVRSSRTEFPFCLYVLLCIRIQDYLTDVHITMAQNNTSNSSFTIVFATPILENLVKFWHHYIHLSLETFGLVDCSPCAIVLLELFSIPPARRQPSLFVILQSKQGIEVSLMRRLAYFVESSDPTQKLELLGG